MNKIFSVLNHRFAYHIYLWGLLFVGFLFWGSNDNGLIGSLKMSFAFLFPWIIATYTHFFIHTQLFLKRRYLFYGLAAVALILFFGYLSELAVNTILHEKHYERSGYTDVIIILAITTGLRYFRRGISQQYRMQEMEARQLKSELNLLKSQVNPHFLFNTLNNLFSIAQKNNDDETADGLLKLSQLMRYMIYESNVDLVSLEKEITYIRNYIDLQKLRFENQELLKIKFQTTDNLKSTFICPMMLIPFIENAFKHGLSTESQNLIDISLSIENKVLNLIVKNTVSNRNLTDKKNSGIGLENVKRRLNLVYPNKHKLTIDSDNDFFRVNLIIEL